MLNSVSELDDEIAFLDVVHVQSDAAAEKAEGQPWMVNPSFNNYQKVFKIDNGPLSTPRRPWQVQGEAPTGEDRTAADGRPRGHQQSRRANGLVRRDRGCTEVGWKSQNLRRSDET